MKAMNKKKVMIVGLFQNADKAPVTQASELFSLLKNNNYPVLAVSKYKNKWLRLIDIVYKLLFYRNQYEIAVVQFYSGNSFIWQYIAAVIVKFLNKKLIFTIHGGSVPDSIKNKTQQYLSLLKKADSITVPSGYIAKSLNEHSIQSELIENSISLKKYPFAPKGKLTHTLLWMRAFSDIYNPLMAVKVVAELKKKYPDIKIYMGGPDLGGLQATQKLIEELGLQDNIEIVGFMNFQAKIKYARQASVYISTNKIDNAPVSFLEMWAMGLPVISTNVGGVPYLVNDGENGLLIEQNDYTSMAEKVSKIFENKALADKLVNNGRTKVLNYDQNTVYEKWDKLLMTL
jgi:glycosyltransferase involved in cell wall biosynthesis